MNRIQKVSSYLLFIFNGLLVFFPLFYLTLWIFVDASLVKSLISENMLLDPVSTPEEVINLSTVKWSLPTKAVGLLASLVEVFPFLMGLFILKLIFRNYSNGQIFTLSNARYYRYLGYLFFLEALIVTPLSETLMVLAATLNNGVGHRYFQVQIGTPALKSLFCGVLILVISWIMVEACKLQDDQQLTI